MKFGSKQWEAAVGVGSTQALAPRAAHLLCAEKAAAPALQPAWCCAKVSWSLCAGQLASAAVPLALCLAPCKDKAGKAAAAASLRDSAAHRGSATRRSYNTPSGHSSGGCTVLAVLPAIAAGLADAPAAHGASGSVDCSAAALAHWNRLSWAGGAARCRIVQADGANDASKDWQVRIRYEEDEALSTSATQHCGLLRQNGVAIHLGRIAMAYPERRFL